MSRRTSRSSGRVHSDTDIRFRYTTPISIGANIQRSDDMNKPTERGESECEGPRTAENQMCTSSKQLVITRRNYLPATQCAAVTTHLAATRDPPQKCLFDFVLQRLTCQGKEPASTFFPPTILPRRIRVGRPQTK